MNVQHSGKEVWVFKMNVQTIYSVYFEFSFLHYNSDMLYTVSGGSKTERRWFPLAMTCWKTSSSNFVSSSSKDGRSGGQYPHRLLRRRKTWLRWMIQSWLAAPCQSCRACCTQDSQRRETVRYVWWLNRHDRTPIIIRWCMTQTILTDVSRTIPGSDIGTTNWRFLLVSMTMISFGFERLSARLFVAVHV